MSVAELASYIDYSVLKPEFTEQEIIDLTKDGVKLGCATICINPGYMDLCSPLVKGSITKLCPVCDFPFGNSSTESKVAQAKILCKYDTIGEIDIVANFGWIRSGKYDAVTADIKAVVDVCHEAGYPVKVIFETDALTEEQVRKTCECCMEAGADFVKTSTGFSDKGATVEDILLMKQTVGNEVHVKASGGIRDAATFKAMVAHGAERIGTSAGVSIIAEFKKEADEEGYIYIEEKY